MDGLIALLKTHIADSSSTYSCALLRLKTQTSFIPTCPAAQTYVPPSPASGKFLAVSPAEPSPARVHVLVEEKPVSVSTNDPVRSIAEQLGVGGVLGFTTGFAIRKLGRIVAFFVGTEICILQYLAYRQWLVMDWRRIAKDLQPKLDRSVWRAGVDIVLYKLPFASAFSAGMAAGLRMSR